MWLRNTQTDAAKGMSTQRYTQIGIMDQILQDKVKNKIPSCLYLSWAGPSGRKLDTRVCIDAVPMDHKGHRASLG